MHAVRHSRVWTWFCIFLAAGVIVTLFGYGAIRILMETAGVGGGALVGSVPIAVTSFQDSLEASQANSDEARANRAESVEP